MKHLPISIRIMMAVAALCWLHSCADARHRKAEKALENAQEFLLSIQNEEGAIADTVNPLFDLWETTLALKALAASGMDSNALAYQKGLGYLQANTRPDGLICHNRKCKASYCLETSALYLQLPGIRANNAAATQAILDMQDENGTWAIGNPDVREAQNFPSVTGFVIGLLQSEETPHDHYDYALSSLIGQQNQGNWGQHWEYYDSPAYALWAILPVFAQAKEPKCDIATAESLTFLKNSQAEDGSWNWIGQGWANHPSAELHTALSLLAMLSATNVEFELEINKAVDFIISRQRPDGSWDGGNFPIESQRYVKQEYVAATAWAMMALANFLQL